MKYKCRSAKYNAFMYMLSRIYASSFLQPTFLSSWMFNNCLCSTFYRLDTETLNIYTSDSIRPPRHYYTVKGIRNQEMNSTDAEQEWILKPDLPPWVSFPHIFICDIRVAWWYVCRFIKKNSWSQWTVLTAETFITPFILEKMSNQNTRSPLYLYHFKTH